MFDVGIQTGLDFEWRQLNVGCIAVEFCAFIWLRGLVGEKEQSNERAAIPVLPT